MKRKKKIWTRLTAMILAVSMVFSSQAVTVLADSLIVGGVASGSSDEETDPLSGSEETQESEDRSEGNQESENSSEAAEESEGESETAQETDSSTYSSPEEMAEDYYGENAGTPVTVASVRISPDFSGTEVKAGETVNYVIRYTLNAAATYGYVNQAEPLYDTYDDTEIRLKLPEGLTIDTEAAVSGAAVSYDETAGEYVFTLDAASINAESASSGSFSIPVTVEGNGSLEIGHLFDLDGSEDYLTITTNFTVKDKTDEENIQDVKTYTQTNTSSSALASLTSATDDVWGIEKSHVSSTVSEDNGTITLRFLLKVGLTDSDGTVISDPEVYGRVGRVPFADGNISLTEALELQDREGNAIDPDSITVTENFGQGSSYTFTEGEAVSVNTDTCGAHSLSGVDGAAPYYFEYYVDVVYDYDPFIAQYYEENQELLTVGNTASLQYTLKGGEADTDEASASAQAGEVTEPAMLTIRKYIRENGASGTGELYAYSEDGWGDITGAAEFTITDSSGNPAVLYTMNEDGTYTVLSRNGTVSIDPSQEEEDGTATVYLDPGTYTIAETAAPENTVSQTEPQEKELTAGGSAAADFINEEVLGTVRIEKSGMVNGITSGLNGAVFGLYAGTDPDCEGEPLRTGTTAASGSADGILEFEHLAAGTYYVKEIEAPSGYIADDTIWTVVIQADSDNTVTVTAAGNEDTSVTDWVESVNDSNTAYLRLQKQYYWFATATSQSGWQDVNSGNYRQFNGSFTLQRITDPSQGDWETVASGLSLNQDGTYLSGALPVYSDKGEVYYYRFREVLPQEWHGEGETTETEADGTTVRVLYSSAVSLEGKLGHASSDPVEVTMQNTQNGTLILTKKFTSVSSQGSKTTAAADEDSTASFDLYQEVDGVFSKVNEDSYTTDANGQITVTDLPVLSGGETVNYYWVETDASGYLLESSGNNVTEITADGETLTAVGPFNFLTGSATGADLNQSVTVTNVEQKVPVRIQKTDSNTDSYLAGASVTIYRGTVAEENIVSGYDNVSVPEGGLTVVLETGYQYIIVETGVPEHYSKGENITVDLRNTTVTSTSVDLIEETLGNEADPSVRIIKTRLNADGSVTTLAGTEFEVYTKNEQGEFVQVTDEDKEPVILTAGTALYLDAEDLLSYSSSRLARVSNGGEVYYRLTVSNPEGSGENYKNLTVMDALPARGDITAGGTSRNSAWPVYLSQIDSVTVAGRAVDYTVYYYTGVVTAQTYQDVKEAQGQVPEGWTAQASDLSEVTAFIIAVDSDEELLPGENMVVTYTADVENYDSADLEEISYQNTVNHFVFHYSSYRPSIEEPEDAQASQDILESNSVSATILPAQVQVGGHVWIDADGNGVQDDGSIADYSQYAIVQDLLDKIVITLNTYTDRTTGRDSTPTGMEEYDQSSDSSWYDTANYIFSGLDAGLLTVDEESAYDAEGNLITRYLKGTSPATYILTAALTGVIGDFVLTTMEGSGISRNPAEIPDSEKTDNNFDTETGSMMSERFYLWATDVDPQDETTWDNTKDIGFVLYRDLQITKTAADDSETMLERAEFEIYGPFDAGEVTGENVSSLLTEENLAGSYTTDASGEICAEDLLWFKEYVIVETKAAQGYELDGATASGENISALGDNMWLLGVPDTDSTVTVDTVTVGNVRQTEVSLSAEKILNGKNLTDNTFTFQLLAEDGETVLDEQTTALTDAASVSVTFASQTVQGTGEHTFYIREVIPQENPSGGVTYDTSVYRVAVTTIWDEAEEELKVDEIQYYREDSGTLSEDGAVFTNTYTAAGSWTPEGTKTLAGRDMKEGESFTFSVREVESLEAYDPGDPDTYTEVSEGSVTGGTEGASQEIAFTSVSYNLEDVGEHTYVIIETGTPEDGVTLDDTVYTVSVQVTDSGDGTLLAEPSYPEGGAAFTNEYHASGTVTLDNFTKLLTGSSLLAGQFSFALADEEGEILQTVTNGEDGSIEFEPLEYHETDIGQTYTYTVSEVQGDAEGITYDQTVYTVEVTVADSEDSDGTLALTVRILNGDQELEGEGEALPQAVFTNAFAGSVTLTKQGEDGSSFYCTVEEGSSSTAFINLSQGEDTASAALQNVYVDIPDNGNYYWSGTLEITKRVLRDGEAATAEDTFYAGIFELTESGDYELVTETELKQNDTVTVTGLSGPVGGSMTYYVFETDGNGNMISDDPNFLYSVSGEGSVTITETDTTGRVTITNEAVEETTAVEIESDSTESAASDSSSSGTSNGTSVKTGDTTDIMPALIGLIAAGLAVMALGFSLYRRRRRNGR